MEIFLDERLPTYAGGLGVLAGDMLRACADLRVPMVAVTMLYRKGYFRQRLGPDGGQEESADDWQPESSLQRLPESVQVTIEGRPVRVNAWRFDVVGRGRLRGARAAARHRASGEPPERPGAQRFPLRRRGQLPPGPGDRARHRGRAHAARARLRGPADVPPERGACGAGGDRADAGALVPDRPVGSPGGPAPLRVHHPHPGARRARSVRSRPGGADAGRTGAGVGAGGPGRQRADEHDAAGAQPEPLHQRRRPGPRAGGRAHVPGPGLCPHHQRGPLGHLDRTELPAPV